MSMEESVQTLAQECAELLDAMEAGLLRLEHVPDDEALINEIFRAAHTIKGSAGLLAFDAIVRFAHRVESVLVRVREGSLGMDGSLTALLLACCDHLRALVREATAGEVEPGRSNIDARLMGELERYLGNGAPGHGGAGAQNEPVKLFELWCDEDDAQPTAATGSAGAAAPSPAPVRPTWNIQLGFGREVLRHGMEPLGFLRYLARLGELRALETRLDAIPPAREMDPECCYLSFDLTLESAATRAEIAQVFELVQDDCELRIELVQERAPTTPPREAIPEALPAPASTPTAAHESAARESAARGSAAHGSAAHEASQPAPITAARAGAERPPPGGKEPPRSEPKARDGHLIRVDAEKLDQLIDRVGELVIAGAGARLHAERARHAGVIEAALSVSRLVEEVRNAALGLRMVQVGATFQRFQRVVRDVSHELDKDIALVIDGAETELDKSMVEKLSDPLLHLVRNAMDHGIEPVEARRRAGKAERGQLRLNAYHDSGSVVVEVSDDGGGLNRERILEKAIERGLVSREQQLTDAEVFALIFEAGFSTADQVSSLSGRGVGMDVVRTAVEALRGTVELESHAGRGTTVRIRLPLTLAIIDGFLVRCGSVHCVIPLEMVVGCLGFGAADRRSAQERGFINVRGAALPVVPLAERFGLVGSPGARQNVVVVKSKGQSAGLVVDELLGELQTVIKPLGKLFSQVRGISGSALLGSGEVALILDVNVLVQDLVRSGNKAGEHRTQATGTA